MPRYRDAGMQVSLMDGPHQGLDPPVLREAKITLPVFESAGLIPPGRANLVHEDAPLTFEVLHIYIGARKTRNRPMGWQTCQ